MYSCEDCGALKRRHAKSLGRHSGRCYTVDHRAVLKAYPKVPHLQLFNALCMECARWGMSAGNAGNVCVGILPVTVCLSLAAISAVLDFSR